MITILTPTYNREKTLPRLYKTLEAQNNKSFEWVIIDDGSTDTTEELINSYINRGSFSIRYYKKNNGGKHTALNKGIPLCKTEWIFIVDSDDALPDNSIEVIMKEIEVLTEDYVGLCFRKALLNKVLVGNSDDSLNDEQVLTPTQAGALYQGDLAYVFRKNEMLVNPFPVFQGEKFVPELFIWNKISDGGLIKCFGKRYVYLCEYLDDGYSRNFSSNLRRNPKGFALFYKAQIARESKIIAKIKNAIRYVQCQWYILKVQF